MFLETCFRNVVYPRRRVCLLLAHRQRWNTRGLGIGSGRGHVCGGSAVVGGGWLRDGEMGHGRMHLNVDGVVVQVLRKAD